MATFASSELAVENTLVTTDATPTQIITAPMVPSSVATIFLKIVAGNPSNGDSKGFGRMVTLKRVGNAAATVVGSVGDLLPSAADAGASAWTISLTTIGNSLSLNVIGAAATTIHWYAWAQGVIVT